jgi:hypothetical protein
MRNELTIWRLMAFALALAAHARMPAKAENTVAVPGYFTQLATQPGVPMSAVPLQMTSVGSATTLAAATVDLTTRAGTSLMQGVWRYSDARVVSTSFRAPDAQGKPDGEIGRAYGQVGGSVVGVRP